MPAALTLRRSFRLPYISGRSLWVRFGSTDRHSSSSKTCSRLNCKCNHSRHNMPIYILHTCDRALGLSFGSFKLFLFVGDGGGMPGNCPEMQTGCPGCCWREERDTESVWTLLGDLNESSSSCGAIRWRIASHRNLLSGSRIGAL